MKQSNAFFKISILGKIVIALFLLFLPLSESYAKAGCCARHGGVAGCNTATGYQKCKDGSSSASCVCEGSNAPTTKATKVKPAQLPTTTTKSTTKPVITPVKPAKTAGCCRGHGGVAHCNKSSGYQKCKDGTMSATCKCS